MRKISLAVLLLVLAVAVCRGESPKNAYFIFKGVDTKRDMVILHPVIAPDLFVQLDSGPRTPPAAGAGLNCKPSARSRKAIVEGENATVGELLLECGEQVFVVKAIDFGPS